MDWLWIWREDLLERKQTTENLIKVYIQIDARNLITEINSEIFLSKTDGYIQIDQGTGDKYAHAQGHYLGAGLYDEQGHNNYIYDGDIVRLLTDGEKEVLFPPKEAEPSSDEIQNDFNIDVDYRLSCLELGI